MNDKAYAMIAILDGQVVNARILSDEHPSTIDNTCWCLVATGHGRDYQAAQDYLIAYLRRDSRYHWFLSLLAYFNSKYTD